MLHMRKTYSEILEKFIRRTLSDLVEFSKVALVHRGICHYLSVVTKDLVTQYFEIILF